MDISSKLESLKALHQMNESMKGAMCHNLCSITVQFFLRAINCITTRIYVNELKYRKSDTEKYYCSGDQIAKELANNPNSTWVIQSITNLCIDNAFNHNHNPYVDELYDIEEKDELFQDLGFINLTRLAGDIISPMLKQEEKCDGNCEQCKHFKKDAMKLFDNVCCQDAVSAYLMKHYFYHEESRISKESYINTISSYLIDTASEILGIEFDPSHDKIDCEEIVRGQFALLFAWGFCWWPVDFYGHISIFYNSHSLGVKKYCKEIKEGNIDDSELTEEERILAIYCYDTLSKFSIPDDDEDYEPASIMYSFPDGMEGEYILLMEDLGETKDIKWSSLNHSSLLEYLAIVDIARLAFGERIEKFCKERSSYNLK